MIKKLFTLIVVIALIGSVIQLFSGKSEQKTPPPVAAIAQNIPAQSSELDKIKVSVEIDYGIKKDNANKYIIKVENTSDKKFSGKVSVRPTTSIGFETADIDIPQLLPKEIKTAIAFAEIKPNTKFEHKVSGHLDQFDVSSNLK